MTSETATPEVKRGFRFHPKTHPLARRVLIGVAVFAVLAIATYFAAVTWGISHRTLTLYDSARQRPVAVDIAMRRDVEMRADAGMTTMPVVIINHGNTVRFTEYSFLSNFFAGRGYLAISIQHDLASDAPLVTKKGEPYVGREPIYARGVANILFAIHEVSKRQPHADYKHLTLVGHSNGGDIAMYFAKEHPGMVADVITLDNLRVPLQGAFRILTFRSKDPQFVPDTGVVPQDGKDVTVVNTKYRHTDMSDRGPDSMKLSIEETLSKFLSKEKNSDLAPVNTDKIDVPPPPGAQAKKPAQK
jgi:hypothetical protein